MRKNIIILLTLLGSTNCTDTNQISNNSRSESSSIASKDFYFIMDFNKEQADNFNSKTGVFTRRYSSGDSSAKINLTDQEKLIVYKLILENDFLSLPATISPDTILDKGVEATKIVVNMDGKLKEVQCFNFKNAKQTKQLEMFGLIKKGILDILNTKTDFSAWRPVDFVRL